MTLNLFGLSSIYVQWNDLLDILIVAFIVYRAIKLFKETRAIQLLKGIAFLILVFFLSNWLELRTLNYVLKNTLEVGLFAIIVLFQPELKRALERIGGNKFLKFFGLRSTNDVTDIDTINMVDNLSEAFGRLRETKTGALVVLERNTKIGDIISTGTAIDAAVSSRLIENIFYKGAALHDGALIIRDNRVAAAGCILPLSQNMRLSYDLGTRHRAAIGMSENSDAIVCVVSEETGHISIAIGGVIHKNLSKEQMSIKLKNILVPNQNKKSKRSKNNTKGDK